MTGARWRSPHLAISLFLGAETLCCEQPTRFGNLPEPEAKPQAPIESKLDAGSEARELADTGLPKAIRFLELPNAIPANIRDEACMDALVVDIEMDGDLDIVLAIEFGPNRLLLNDGQGTFQASTSLPSSNRDSEDALAFDFDSDGDLDLIFVSEDDQVNELFANTTASAPVASSPSFEILANAFPATGTSNGAVLADINNDSRMDILVANAGPNTVFLNNPDGSFTEGSAGLFPDNNATSQDVEVGDVDGDGDLDIVWANEGQNELWLQENGRFVNFPNYLPIRDDETREIDLGDLDSDGDLDMVVANVQLFTSFDQRNQVFLNDGRGKFSLLNRAFPDDGLSSFDIDLADINYDGILDAVVANWSGRGPAPYTLLTGLGDGTFEPQALPELNFEESGLDVEIADFNGDGNLDLYLCSRGGIGFGGSRDHLLMGQQ